MSPLQRVSRKGFHFHRNENVVTLPLFVVWLGQETRKWPIAEKRRQQIIISFQKRANSLLSNTGEVQWCPPVTLTSAEINYSTAELELPVIAWSTSDVKSNH